MTSADIIGHHLPDGFVADINDSCNRVDVTFTIAI